MQVGGKPKGLPQMRKVQYSMRGTGRRPTWGKLWCGLWLAQWRATAMRSCLYVVELQGSQPWTNVKRGQNVQIIDSLATTLGTSMEGSVK